MTRSVVAALLVGLGAGTGIASAQEAGGFKVTPAIGVIRFDRTSALSSTESGLSTQLWASGGLMVMYQVNANLEAGAYLEGGRAETSSDYYPYALFRSVGSYQLFGVSQRVIWLSYGVTAAVKLPVGQRFGPYLRGGVGGHSVFPDVQRQNTVKTVTGLEFVVGGGAKYDLSSTVGVRLELVDFLWKDWDRDELYPVVDPALQNTVFAEDNPAARLSGKPSLIHNMRLALGFIFTPSGGGAR